MSVIEYGKIIKARREELGLLQEDLAEGICSLSTLSRIESGGRVPQKETLERLLQRLGLSEIGTEYYTGQEQLEIHRLKLELMLVKIEENTEAARALLEKLKAALPEPDNMDRQILLFHEVTLYEKEYSERQRLEKMEEALRLTQPRYTPDCLPRVMSYWEILALNYIACSYGELGQKDTAARMLYHILDFYERKVVNPEESWRTSPMIYYNLSKYLGLAGRYDECIEVAEKGIRMAKRSGRASSLCLTYFNCAWSLVKRKGPGDMERAKEYAKRSVCMAYAMDHPSLSRRVEFYRSNFGGDFSLSDLE